MNEPKDIRWRQRFANFERSYQLLFKYRDRGKDSELERAGIIQFFEISFELAWKLMKDYLESQQLYPKTPRETIKQAYQIDLIDEGHLWIDALEDRNRTVHTYDQEAAKKMVEDITRLYLPLLERLYKKLLVEIK